MGFPLRSEFENANQSEAGSLKQAMTSKTSNHFFAGRLSSQISFETQKGNFTMKISKFIGIRAGAEVEKR